MAQGRSVTECILVSVFMCVCMCVGGGVCLCACVSVCLQGVCYHPVCPCRGYSGSRFPDSHRAERDTAFTTCQTQAKQGNRRQIRAGLYSSPKLLLTIVLLNYSIKVTPATYRLLFSSAQSCVTRSLKHKAALACAVLLPQANKPK